MATTTRADFCAAGRPIQTGWGRALGSSSRPDHSQERRRTVMPCKFTRQQGKTHSIFPRGSKGKRDRKGPRVDLHVGMQLLIITELLPWAKQSRQGKPFPVTQETWGVLAWGPAG